MILQNSVNFSKTIYIQLMELTALSLEGPDYHVGKQNIGKVNLTWHHLSDLKYVHSLSARNKLMNLFAGSTCVHV
jgi:hypothetical protein